MIGALVRRMNREPTPIAHSPRRPRPDMTALALPFAMTAPAGRERPARAEPIVARVADDQRRVEELYLRLERKLTSVVYRWLWNREETRDVIQEAFVRLWQMRDRVDWGRAEPLVYRIALNLASKRRRSRRIWQFVTLSELRTDAPDDTAASGSGDEAAREQLVRRAIDALPERHRRVLVMTMHAEMTYGEIGEVLGISPGTVGSRRNTAIQLLRAMLQREARDD
jgi:RNA polymerase sigma-70 factor (ECF subfamily)